MPPQDAYTKLMKEVANWPSDAYDDAIEDCIFHIQSTIEERSWFKRDVWFNRPPQYACVLDCPEEVKEKYLDNLELWSDPHLRRELAKEQKKEFTVVCECMKETVYRIGDVDDDPSDSDPYSEDDEGEVPDINNKVQDEEDSDEAYETAREENMDTDVDHSEEESE